MIAETMPDLDVVIGLGANLGDPVGALLDARRALVADWSLLAASHLYHTAPVGPAQPDFVNAALRGTWSGSPEALLYRLLDIERQLGRVRDERWGPRTIDLDVLWIAGLSVDHAQLCVPHPRLGERAFALIPLLDVAPAASDPVTGLAYSAKLLALPSQRVERRCDRRWVHDCSDLSDVR